MQAVLVPCRRFDVEVSFGGDEGLGVVDQFVLRTIAGGARTVDALAERLCLPKRMAFDAMLSLLGAGWLTVEHHGEIDIAPQIRAAMGNPDSPPEGWSKPFVPLQPAALRSVTLTQELVSGSIFTMGRVPLLERERLPQMPRSQDVLEPDEIPIATLIPTVVTALRDHRRDTSTARADLEGIPAGARITTLRIRRVGSSVVMRSLLVQTNVLAIAVPERETLQFRVVGPDGLPPRVRTSIASALNTMRATERGRATFFDRLQVSEDDGEIPEGFLQAPGRMFAKIETSIPMLAEVRPEDAATTHRCLRDVDDEVSSVLEQLSVHEATSTFVSGSPAVFQELAIEALQKSRHQVVLASPWLGQFVSDRRWRETISKAIERTVSVVLIWGIDGAEPISGAREWRVIEQLQSQNAENSGGLIVARRGAGNHAKVIIRDVEWALVSSCNFLNASPTSAVREAGIAISSIDERTASLPVLEILRWLERTIPEVAVRSRVLLDSMHFGRVDNLGSLRAGPPQVDLPQFSSQAGPLASLGFSIWRDAWTRRFEWQRTACSVAGRAVLTVMDGQHRDLFVSAIAMAQKRLGIASHSVRAHGLSARVHDLLLQALDREVDVRIVVGRPDERTTDTDAQDRLRSLAARGAVVQFADNHAKVVVCDDWLSVSSFNFLGQDPSERSAHELGVRVFDQDQVEAAWRALFDQAS
jgi:hypothetical protein